MGSFEITFEDRFPDRCEVFSSLKVVCISEKCVHMLLMLGIRLK